MLKEHHAKTCCMRKEAIPRLLAIVMQIGQTILWIDALLQGIVCLLEVT